MNFKEHFFEIDIDLWQYLSETNIPIVLYGIGDGADKIYSVLESKNISISGVFASDNFVPKKKKLFHGFIIKSYAEIKEEFEKVIILVCFGTNIADVIENIRYISKENEVYAPDVPVFGDGLFDQEYFIKNFKRLENIYNLLADDISKFTFVSSIKFKLTGKIDYLFSCETGVKESYDTIISKTNISSYIDIGAYNGDTIREFEKHISKTPKIYAFEPDKKNFKKLSEFAQNSELDITTYNLAAWDKTEKITFFSRSGRNSASTTSHKNEKEIIIDAASVDEICEFANYIKIDAEGSDKNALLGMKRIISSFSPTINIAAYHRTEDYFVIPETVLLINNNYDVYFRHFQYIPSWDTNFYFKSRDNK